MQKVSQTFVKERIRAVVQADVCNRDQQIGRDHGEYVLWRFGRVVLVRLRDYVVWDENVFCSKRCRDRYYAGK